MPLWIWLTAIIAGATGQFVDALAGMGFGAFSGSVMLAGGLAPTLVILTVSLTKIGSGLVSGLAHWRFGNVRWTWVAPLAISSIGGGIIGGLLLTHLPASASRVWVPALLIMMGLLILRRFLLPGLSIRRVGGASQNLELSARPSSWQRIGSSLMNMPSAFRLGGIGLAAGALNSLSGAYGPFATSSVILAQGGHPRFAVGTVNLVEIFAATATSVTLLSQINRADFPWELPAALMIGAVFTVPLGAYLARHLPEKIVGIGVGLILIVINAWALGKVIL
ncbi:MAG: sulfite exporter TauE/SafE family protein [Chloroflexi bacterium]|nr:sulfite exporter TauE/SafE family protein [Chloroflexota bacterium]